MVFVDCVVEENIPIVAVIDSGVNINVIKQKFINKLGLTYYIESNSIEMPDTSYSTLGKVNLYISFNDSEKHKTIPSEFIVLGPDWPGLDLILGMP